MPATPENTDAFYRRFRGVQFGAPADEAPDAAILALRLVVELAKELDAAGVPMTGKMRALVARIRAAEAGP